MKDSSDRRHGSHMTVKPWKAEHAKSATPGVNCPPVTCKGTIAYSALASMASTAPTRAPPMIGPSRGSGSTPASLGVMLPAPGTKHAVLNRPRRSSHASVGERMPKMVMQFVTLWRATSQPIAGALRENIVRLAYTGMIPKTPACSAKSKEKHPMATIKDRFLNPTRKTPTVLSK
mmetsp:Transcript_111699/g.216335  ORF Transcript_111699/g.216335 Transcript_111699/m.216335 type:complete len:175 (-) Transcript_111699:787-1311(-)